MSIQYVCGFAFWWFQYKVGVSICILCVYVSAYSKEFDYGVQQDVPLRLFTFIVIIIGHCFIYAWHAPQQDVFYNQQEKLELPNSLLLSTGKC